MKKYDKYQKFIRYKYGYYSFNLLISLFLLNYFLGLIFNFQWAATKELEVIIIMFVVVLFFVNISVYQNAYFRKGENKKSYSWLFLIVGLFSLYTAFQTFLISPEEIIIDGKLGRGVIQLFSGLIFISVPLTYFIRVRIDKKMENKEQ
ncbi:hypothetical protein JHE06_00595 [Carnobacterium sp. CS13]|uniref:hypothetical protein n=1 Tax=Carnobacterium sp. CS13 TaxID=2800128 RepID=UPI001911FF8F|nr:hypothetical protein [Carnobacterium sp. CS13]QQP70391.1 hypothetical protein JHE06_00595 [Carnobacterium sp. CS13]